MTIKPMTSPGLYRAASRQFRPWKNGGGQTADILSYPIGAGFDDFDWRISTAIVAHSGPFSMFPGVDRVLTVLEGGTLSLSMGGKDFRLDPSSLPLAFAADLPVYARIGTESILDFNVMVRRPFHATVRRCAFALSPPAAPDEIARLGLLLADAAGLNRLDLVDLRVLHPAIQNTLADAPVLEVVISTSKA